MIPDNPRIMVTNDDGVDAAGIKTLEEIAAEMSDDVWVCAPAHEQSGASRKMSLSEPIPVRRLDDRRFAVFGTPSDAAFLGIHDLICDKRPDLVLSGVNRGQNLAEDVTVSGTIAAAFQAMQLGIPAVAFSQTFFWRDGAKPPYETARAHAPDLLRRLIKAGWPEDVVLNVNFPDCAPDEVKGVAVTRHGRRDQWRMHAERRQDLRGRDYYWLGFEGKRSNTAPGEDLHAVYGNEISVTPLRLDLTHEDTRAHLQAALGAASADV